MSDPAIQPGDTLKLGDVLSFTFRDVLPPDDPLSKWLVLLAAAFNDLAFVNDRLEEDYDTPHQYLYWLRLGVSHFSEACHHLERFRSVPEVKQYIESLDEEVQRHYDDCLAIFANRRKELRAIRNTLFHYLATVDGEPLVENALTALADTRTTLRTGTVRTSRLLFADDVAATIFTGATGVPWSEVTHDDSQKHVGEVQLHIQEAVAAFIRFANPALMEPVTRAIAGGAKLYKVEPVDPDDWRAGWKVVGT